MTIYTWNEDIHNEYLIIIILDECQVFHFASF